MQRPNQGSTARHIFTVGITCRAPWQRWNHSLSLSFFSPGNEHPRRSVSLEGRATTQPKQPALRLAWERVRVLCQFTSSSFLLLFPLPPFRFPLVVRLRLRQRQRRGCTNPRRRSRAAATPWPGRGVGPSASRRIQETVGRTRRPRYPPNEVPGRRRGALRPTAGSLSPRRIFRRATTTSRPLPAADAACWRRLSICFLSVIL